MPHTLLLCIGSQKAGTTWLADYFRDHPQVHLPPVKEVHYFDARFVPDWCRKYEEEMLAEFKAEVSALTRDTCGDPALQQKLHAMLLRFRMIANPAEYLRFVSWGAQLGQVLFEASPDYMMMGEDGFRAIRDIHPNPKMILLMRNPADRFWSSLRFNKTHNPEFDIEVMFDRLVNREDFRLLTDYGRTIKTIQSVFPAGRLHVEFYERLFEPPAIERICRFAGVANRPAAYAERSNEAIPMSLPPARRRQAVEAYAQVYKDVHALFQGDVPESWKQDLAAIS